MKTTRQNPWTLICLAGLVLASANTHATAAYLPSMVYLLGSDVAHEVPTGSTVNLGGMNVMVAFSPRVLMTRFNLHVEVTSKTATPQDVTNLKLVDNNGRVITSIPRLEQATDGHWFAIRYPWKAFNVGYNAVTLTADLSTRFSHGDTIRVWTNPPGDLFMDPFSMQFAFVGPTTSVGCGMVTVKTARVIASMPLYPQSATVLAGTNTVLCQTITLDTRDSIEDLLVHEVQTLILPKGSAANMLTNVRLSRYGQVVAQMEDPKSAPVNQPVIVSFNPDLLGPLLLVSGTVTTLEVSAEVPAATLSGSAFQFGLFQTGEGEKPMVQATGVKSGSPARFTTRGGYDGAITVMRTNTAPHLLDADGGNIVQIDSVPQSVSRLAYDGQNVVTVIPAQLVSNPVAVGILNGRVYVATGQDTLIEYDWNLKPMCSVPVKYVRGLVKDNPRMVITDTGITEYQNVNGQLTPGRSFTVGDVHDAAYEAGSVYVLFPVVGHRGGLAQYQLTATSFEWVRTVWFDSEPVALSAMGGKVAVLSSSYIELFEASVDETFTHLGRAPIAGRQVTIDPNGIYVLSGEAAAGTQGMSLTTFELTPVNEALVERTTVGLGQSIMFQDMARSSTPEFEWSGPQFLVTDGRVIHVDTLPNPPAAP